MQQNPNYLPMEYMDRGYAKLFVNRTGEAISKGKYQEYIDTVAINQALMGDPENLRHNYYFIAGIGDDVQDVNAIRDTIDKIDSNLFSCRCYCTPQSLIDEFISRYFPAYDGSKRNVRIIETNKHEETMFVKTFLVNQGLKQVYTSVLRDFSNITMLSVLDAYRNLIINGEDIAFVSHISQELQTAEMKFSFINGFVREKSDDIKWTQ